MKKGKAVISLGTVVEVIIHKTPLFLCFSSSSNSPLELDWRCIPKSFLCFVSSGIFFFAKSKYPPPNMTSTSWWSIAVSCTKILLLMMSNLPLPGLWCCFCTTRAFSVFWAHWKPCQRLGQCYRQQLSSPQARTCLRKFRLVKMKCDLFQSPRSWVWSGFECWEEFEWAKCFANGAPAKQEEKNLSLDFDLPTCFCAQVHYFRERALYFQCVEM